MSDGTGFLFDGLFLSTVKPKLGQKGLLLDNKYFLPLVEGGGSAEYYRCASVDTSAKTWTGYKAVLNGGVYTFEDTVTTGLSYTSVTPQVGNIYNNDALAKISGLYQGIPFDGLVFYAPLTDNSSQAETGQELTIVNYNSCEVVDGITGMLFNNTKIKSVANEYAIGTKGTISVWFYYQGDEQCQIFRIGAKENYSANPDGRCFSIGISYGAKLGIDNWTFAWNSEFNVLKNSWVHLIVMFDDTNFKVYINGEKSHEGINNSSAPFNVQMTELYIGYSVDITALGFFDGYISNVRVYSREPLSMLFLTETPFVSI